jgi:hypothetical protein
VVVAVQVDIAIGQLSELLLSRPQVVQEVRELLWCVMRYRVCQHRTLMLMMTSVLHQQTTSHQQRN